MHAMARDGQRLWRSVHLRFAHVRGADACAAVRAHFPPSVCPYPPLEGEKLSQLQRQPHVFTCAFPVEGLWKSVYRLQMALVAKRVGQSELSPEKRGGGGHKGFSQCACWYFRAYALVWVWRNKVFTPPSHWVLVRVGHLSPLLTSAAAAPWRPSHAGGGMFHMQSFPGQ